MNAPGATAACDPRESAAVSLLDSAAVRRVVWTAFGVLAALGPAPSVAFGLPTATKWIDESLLAALIGLVVLRLIARRTIPRGLPAASWPLVAFTAMVVVSAAVNHTGVVEAVLGWRMLAQFLLFGAALVALGFDLPDLKHFFGGFFVVIVVHVPFAIGQVIAANTARIPLGTDDVTGGFGHGTANLAGYVCALVLLITLCHALIARRRRFWLVALPIGIMWPFTAGNGSYLVFTVLCLAAFVLSPELRRWQNVLKILAFVAFEIACIGYLSNTQYQVSLGDQMFSPLRNLTKYRIDHMGNPGRLVLTRDTVLMLGEDRRALLVGLGPGSVGTVTGWKASNFVRFSRRTQANFVSASVIGYLAELGATGVAIVLLGWAHILSMAWRVRRSGSGPDEVTWLLVAILAVPFVVLAGGGDMSWSFQPLMYPVAALSAFATVRFHRAVPKGAFADA